MEGDLATVLSELQKGLETAKHATFVGQLLEKRNSKARLFRMDTMDTCTFPKLLREKHLKWGDGKVALREKDYGLWNIVTWKGYYEHVKYFALGLKSLGFERGEHISIIGNNEPEWVYAELAVQSLGGVVIGIYQDSTPAEVKYVAPSRSQVCCGKIGFRVYRRRRSGAGG